MILKKKTITTFIALGAVSMFIGAGCGSDDDDAAGTGGMGGASGGGTGDGDGDGTGGTGGTSGGYGDCASLCAESAEKECATEAACLGACQGLELACAAEMAAYLDCADSGTVVTCNEASPIGIVPTCLVEAQALGACGLGGGGGMGGGGAGGM